MPCPLRAYFGTWLLIFARPPRTLGGGGSIAPNCNSGLFDFSSDGLCSMSVIGEVCGHHDVTLNLLGLPLSEDLPNREQLVALRSPLRWHDLQMTPCAIGQ